jgi:hypothetical protein
MSIGDWYRHKADQCARLAQDASEPDRRTRYEEEAKVWRRMVDQIEANESIRFGPDPME